MRLYIVRHGQTDWNLNRKLQGHSDIPLNENGIKMAHETAEKFKNVPIDYVFSSPLKRALETAEIILGNRNLPIKTDNRLREVGFGEFEGMSLTDMGESFQLFSKFFTDPEHYKTPVGGETYDDVQRRVHSFLEELYHNSQYADKNILIASHGAAIGIMAMDIERTPLKDVWKRKVVPNGSFTIVDVENGTPHLVAYGAQCDELINF